MSERLSAEEKQALQNERRAQREQRLTKKVVDRASRQFEQGKDHFTARSVLAGMAMSMSSSYEQTRDLMATANDGIVNMLEANGASGVVYALREDLGNGLQDSTDYVKVVARSGHPTDTIGVNIDNSVIRARTTDLEE